MKVSTPLETFGPIAAERIPPGRAVGETAAADPIPKTDRVSVSKAALKLSSVEARSSASEARLATLRKQFAVGQLPLVAVKTARAMLEYEHVPSPTFVGESE